MTRATNVAASVRQRLLNRARSQGEEYNLVLTYYAIERLLYRLTLSAHRDRFVLKGAMLYRIWGGPPARLTRDLDLLGFGPSAPRDLTRVFQDIAAVKVDAPDGIVFAPTSVTAEEIRPTDEYAGTRLRLVGRMGSARVYLQVDVGTGDVVVPPPTKMTYPSLLDLPAPRLKVYPMEAVVAEKFQAMIAFRGRNSRMKDFFDVWTLSRRYPFIGSRLRQAILSTFERRGTPLPVERPSILTDEFSQRAIKRRQWEGFVRRAQVRVGADRSLTDVVEEIAVFLGPIVWRDDGRLDTWVPGGPWQETTDA